ncbi:MAG: hypothetical protein ABL984_14630 [Pyrinomonadaceae bacterium]
MCDFCGAFTDIDFAVGMETWNESAPTTLNYQFQKMAIMSRAQGALAAGDQRSYYNIQKEFWDFYYRSFPAYLPPSIDTDKKHAIYLEICAVSSTESAFDPKWQEYGVQQQHLQAAIRYSSSAEGTKAESSSFFRLADFFASITKEGMNSFYRDPKFNIMHELLPEPVHFKMKTSMFVQAWLPYLTPTDADRLLKMLGFSNEYAEIERPSGSVLSCGSCSAPLFAPEGSYKVFCEKCRKATNVRAQFFCMSCGSPNAVPENPAKPIDCGNCGIANRLIQPQFGS